MPGAPACRIRAPGVRRSAVAASNSALAPVWWKNVRRPPSRSIIASVNDVTAPGSVRDPGRVDAQPRALGQDERAVLVVADGAEHADREARPEQAQVDGHVERRAAGAQRIPARSWRGDPAPGKRRSPCATSTTNRPGAHDPRSRPGNCSFRAQRRDRSPPGRPRGCAAERSRPWPGPRGRRGRRRRGSARPAGPAASGRPGPAATPRAGSCGRTGRPGRRAARPGAAARRCPGWCPPTRRECRPPPTDRARPARRARPGRCRRTFRNSGRCAAVTPGQGADDRVVDERPDVLRGPDRPARWD